MTRAYLLACALAWAALLFCVQARADTRDMLAIACGPGHGDLAEPIDVAARRYLQHPIDLVAIMANESGCNMSLVGTHGEVCAMQLLGVARNGQSKAALRSDPALCIATGARWLSLRQVDCGGWFLGFAGYNAKTCAKGKRYARRVLATVARIARELARRAEGRS